MKKVFSKVWFLALSLSLVLSLVACDGMTEKRVSGKNGVSAIASSKWTQVVTEEDLKALFDSEDAYVEDIVLALANDKGNRGYLIVETVYPEEEVANLKAVYTPYLNQPEQLSAAEEEMRSIFMTEREIEQITPLIKGETLTEDQELYFNQELVLQGYLYNMSNDPAYPITLDKITDVQINGQRVQVAEHTYSNTLGTKIRQLDAVLLSGQQYYSIAMWDSDEDFNKNREDFMKVLQSIEVGGAEAAK